MEIENKIDTAEEKEILYHTRSEEAQEIIGRMPHWIIRWGVTAIALFVGLIFIISSFVKYPDTVPAKILITPVHPPAPVTASISAQIEELLVQDGDDVKKDETLMLLENNANYQNVLQLKSIIQEMDTAINLDKKLNDFISERSFDLGIIQSAYQDFVIAINDHKNGNLKSLKEIRTTLRKLLSEINQWEEKYVIKSPATGKVNFIIDLKQSQNIQKDQTLLAIINSSENNNLIITGSVNAVHQNKIKEGQTITIKLASYPFETYGALKGTIIKIAPIAINEEYSINIRLSTGLTTTNNYNIANQSILSALGEIAVEDKTILQRLFEQNKL